MDLLCYSEVHKQVANHLHKETTIFSVTVSIINYRYIIIQQNFNFVSRKAGK